MKWTGLFTSFELIGSAIWRTEAVIIDYSLGTSLAASYAGRIDPRGEQLIGHRQYDRTNEDTDEAEG